MYNLNGIQVSLIGSIVGAGIGLTISNLFAKENIDIYGLNFVYPILPFLMANIWITTSVFERLGVSYNIY